MWKVTRLGYGNVGDDVGGSSGGGRWLVDTVVACGWWWPMAGGNCGGVWLVEVGEGSGGIGKDRLAGVYGVRELI